MYGHIRHIRLILIIHSLPAYTMLAYSSRKQTNIIGLCKLTVPIDNPILPFKLRIATVNKRPKHKDY